MFLILIFSDEPVFGCHLADVCKGESPKVPAFVQRCVAAIERKEENMKTDGLYRASGNLSQVQKIRLQVLYAWYFGIMVCTPVSYSGGPRSWNKLFWPKFFFMVVLILCRRPAHLFCGVGSISRVWSECGKHEIGHTQWRINKCTVYFYLCFCFIVHMQLIYTDNGTVCKEKAIYNLG